MFKIYMTLGYVLAAVAAQTSTFVTTFYPFPTGVDDRSSSWQGTIPLPYAEGCQLILPSYLVCHVFTTTDQFGIPYEEFNQTACDDYLCTQDSYDLLTACLDCIILNGNERPEGYTFNTSLTALPSGPTQTEYPELLPNPNGLIDREHGEAILRNVSEGCARAGTGLKMPTLAPSPTTTGPYYTRWSSGLTRDLPVWTGLTQYTDQLSLLVATITYEYPEGSGSISPTRGPGGGSQQQTGTSSAASAAASTSGAARRQAALPVAGLFGIWG